MRVWNTNLFFIILLFFIFVDYYLKFVFYKLEFLFYGFFPHKVYRNIFFAIYIYLSI